MINDDEKELENLHLNALRLKKKKIQTNFQRLSEREN